MISADVTISDLELERLYGRDYFHGQEYLDYVVEEQSLKLNFRDRVDNLKQLIPNLAELDLFEIGCAYGFFLEETRGVVRRAAGIDISAEAVALARKERGVHAECGDYLAMRFDRQLDIVVMWDTIEHLKRPDCFIEKIAHDLRPGGYVALTTGDVGSLNARLRGGRWRMIHPPTHLHYFSIPTLSRLLSRYGFDMIHASHPGNSRTLGAIAYLLFSLRLNMPVLYEAFRRLPIARWRLTINLFDIAFVVARRR